jgi:4-hydroxy-tetrahydrodipicolinate synthase
VSGTKNSQHGLRGVFTILSTPFSPEGELDEASLRRLAQATAAMGVNGITILGVTSEARWLTGPERSLVTAAVIEVVADRVPVFVGTSHDSTEATVAASCAAEVAGAARVMIAPPTDLHPGPDLIRHYQRVAAEIDIPIILQDYPPLNGVSMSPSEMADLVKAVPQITTIKLEGRPTPQRMENTLALLDQRATVIGGLGGMHLLDELSRGASGTMTGFGYPEILARIWRSWEAGDRSTSAELYYRYLPLLRFEGQTGIGLAIRKEILRRRGLISSAVVRQPGAGLDKGIEEKLSEVLGSLGVQSDFDPISV